MASTQPASTFSSPAPPAKELRSMPIDLEHSLDLEDALELLAAGERLLRDE